MNTLRLLSLSGLLLWLSGCAAVADLAGYDSATLNQQSALMYRQVISEHASKGEVDNKSKTAQRIRRVYERLLPYADAQNQTGQPFHWELTVLRVDEANAMVMPGGKVMVYTAVVEKPGLNDDEIAAIMGHEMIHALKEHSKAKFGQRILTGLGVSIGSDIIASQTGIDPRWAGLGTELVGELGLTLPFSRSNEKEADILGMQLMAQAGYDPAAAISLWQKMAAARDSGSVPEFISTHPSDESRMRDLQAALPAAQQIYQQSRRR